MFLETEAAFHNCSWPIKMARIIWFCSTRVDIGPSKCKKKKLAQVRLSSFYSLCKSRKFLKTKTYSFVFIKKKISTTTKNFKKNQVQIFFALVLAPRSVVYLSPFPHRRSFGNQTVPWDLERNFFPDISCGLSTVCPEPNVDETSKYKILYSSCSFEVQDTWQYKIFSHNCFHPL